MSIISQIGRKHRTTRILIGAIYVVLILGAVTMVYPFLLMLSGSTKSAVDGKHLNVIPRFLVDDDMLYRKHVEGLFNESLDMMNITYGTDTRSFETVDAGLLSTSSHVLLEMWEQFLDDVEVPRYAYAGGYMRADVSKTVPQGLREFKKYVQAQFGDNIEDVKRALGVDVDREPGNDFAGWNAFYVVPEDYLGNRRMPANKDYFNTLWSFKEKQPSGFHYYFSVEGYFKKLYLMSQYSKEIGRYNAEHGTSYTSYDDIRLTRRAPKGSDRERRDWEIFVRETLNPLWIRVDESAVDDYQSFLRAKYGTLELFNKRYGTSYTSFDEIPIVEEPPFAGIALSDWNAFMAGWEDPDSKELHRVPLDAIQIHSVEFMFRDYLRNKFGSLAEVNKALEQGYASFSEIALPQRLWHFEAFLPQRKALRKEFITRNYRAVIDYLVLHGRGIVNTAIYCALAVFFALLVNPLAAYAMSRYRMPSAYKILLFLMLTMAFPPMVTQIPSFLMLRGLNLLNTFAALILPGLAYGYSIFLLKGFFDSLPQDLYDSASIDGASEWTMFWQLTMSLSKPILAVIALQAFTIAYSNFMFALLICQDEKMWTLMVWLYQLQQIKGPAVMYASLLVAAVPTLVIFIFCQNIIIRGIVIPVEK